MKSDTKRSSCAFLGYTLKILRFGIFFDYIPKKA
jgi:hypothetical protein